MSQEQNQKIEEFYNRLREKLETNTQFPTDFLYKFIIPNHENKKQQLYHIFEGTNALIDTKESSSNKYLSFSVKIKVDNTDQIIDFYKKAGEIEGIVSL